ncbi:MAG: hypothetical protein JEZ00_03855 [Anaerolineaceae bacterium]|nr:hypothetical protein [Anaerolineaceae bacterium]
MSILVALICLLYVLTPYIQFTAIPVDFSIGGIQFNYLIGFSTLVSLLSAALAISGANWIFSSHPGRRQRRLFPHWLLPGLTAWAIGVPLGSLDVGVAWWIAFGFGTFILLVVILFEYIVIDLADFQYPIAAIGLSAVAFVLFLILVISAQSAGLRLYLKLPIIILPLALISLRVLYLRTNGTWMVEWAFSIAVIIAQIAMAFHYLPIRPIAAGIFLSGSSYALNSLANAYQENRENQRMWIEPTIIIVLSIILFTFSQL